MEKTVEVFHDVTTKPGETTMVEDLAPKVEQARVAAEEEHQLSVWDALTKNKVVVFWCVFFAFSAIGWYVPGLSRILVCTLYLHDTTGDLMHRSMVP